MRPQLCKVSEKFQLNLHYNAFKEFFLQLHNFSRRLFFLDKLQTFKLYLEFRPN